MSTKFRLLITGFESFPPHTINPTQIIVDQLSIKYSVEIKKAIFPVDFELVEKEYLSLLNSFKPDLIINLGLDANRGTLCLETFAVNTGFDPFGKKINFPIIKDGEASYMTQLNTDKIATELCRLGIPAIRSNYAGNYLCNFIFYHSLKWTKQNQADALFIHIPFTTKLAADLCRQDKTAMPSLPANLINEGINHIIVQNLKTRSKNPLLSNFLIAYNRQ